jgi:hypothetical protein
MHDRPFAIFPHFDRNRLHRRAARTTPIPRLIIQMPRPQTTRTVIAMRCAERRGIHRPLTNDAAKR